MRVFNNRYVFYYIYSKKLCKIQYLKNVAVIYKTC
jgi:hypothetical protein